MFPLPAWPKCRRWSGCGSCSATTRCPPILTWSAIWRISRSRGTWKTLQAKAMHERPDFRAAELGDHRGPEPDPPGQGERQSGREWHLTTSRTFPARTRLRSLRTLSCRSSIAIRARSQRTGYALTQAQEQQQAASDTVLSDVANAYEAVRSNDEVVQLYTSGYLKQAQDSRDISEYAYKRGAASLLGFSRCRTQLPVGSVGLSPGAGLLYDRAGAIEGSGGNEEPAMKLRKRRGQRLVGIGRCIGNPAGACRLRGVRTRMPPRTRRATTPTTRSCLPSRRTRCRMCRC